MNPPPANKPSRNDACPCGSGKKYKLCCARQEAKFSQHSIADLQNWQQHAQRAMARAEFAETEYWYRKLVAAKPNDVSFLAGLGQALCCLHRRREGVGYLLKAAKLLERQAAKSRDPQRIQELSGKISTVFPQNLKPTTPCRVFPRVAKTPPAHLLDSAFYIPLQSDL